MREVQDVGPSQNLLLEAKNQRDRLFLLLLIGRLRSVSGLTRGLTKTGAAAHPAFDGCG
jgi:hypothetical protein